jgi:hypothetical protein
MELHAAKKIDNGFLRGFVGSSPTVATYASASAVAQ